MLSFISLCIYIFLFVSCRTLVDGEARDGWSVVQHQGSVGDTKEFAEDDT